MSKRPKEKTLQNMDKKNVSLETLLQSFLLNQRCKGNSEKTVSWYSENIKRFLNYLKTQEQKPILSNLTLETLMNYLLFLQKKEKWSDHPAASLMAKQKKVSSKTIQTYARALRGWIAWIYEEQYIDEDLSKKFKLPKAQKKIVEILSDEEIKKIFSSFNLNTETGCRNSVMFGLMIDCGLRLSEVIRLNVEDVHINEGYVKVLGKGNKERVVSIGVSLQKVLQKYIFYFRPNPINSFIENLILTTEGKMLTITAVENVFSRLGKKLDIPRLTPHLCRHTFATLYLVKGGDILSLQQCLGHTSLEMVKNYTHLANSFVRLRHKKLSPLDNVTFLT